MPPVDARRNLRRKIVDAIHASSSGEAGRAADRLETCSSACGEAARASASGEARQPAERVTTCASASGEAGGASPSYSDEQDSEMDEEITRIDKVLPFLSRPALVAEADRSVQCLRRWRIRGKLEAAQWDLRGSSLGEARTPGPTVGGGAAPPSASGEAVRATSVSEVSRASASGEAGRAAVLIQKRPAAKDRKGRVRVQVHGVRKWVRKEDAVACEASLQQVYRRLQKKTAGRGPRAAAAWQKAAAAEIATNWGACKWGVARRFRVQPVAPRQAPQGDLRRGWKCRGARARCAGGPGLRRPKWW